MEPMTVIMEPLVFERSLGRYYVLSHSNPALWYHVKFWWEDDERVWACDCWDNLIRFDQRDCKHIFDARKYFEQAQSPPI